MGQGVCGAGVLPSPHTSTTGAQQAGGPALGRLAAAAIIAGLAFMVAAGLLRRSWMPPRLAMPAAGPPLEIAARVPARPVIAILWIGGVLAATGVAAGLAALRRRSPLPIRTILIAALLGVAALVVVPPVGSTDVLDYAIYGHIAALGRSPYVMTPAQYQLLVHLRQGCPSTGRMTPATTGRSPPLSSWRRRSSAGAHWQQRPSG